MVRRQRYVECGALDALMRKRQGRNVCDDDCAAPNSARTAETAVKDVANAADVTNGSIENELLCFLSTKMDHLVKVCADLYTDRENMSAKELAHGIFWIQRHASEEKQPR